MTHGALKKPASSPDEVAEAVTLVATALELTSRALECQRALTTSELALLDHQATRLQVTADLFRARMVATIVQEPGSREVQETMEVGVQDKDQQVEVQLDLPFEDADYLGDGDD